MPNFFMSFPVMPPLTGTIEIPVDKQFLAPDLATIEKLDEKELVQKQDYGKVQPIIWRNVIKFALLHIIALLGFYQLVFMSKWPTILWTFLLFCISQVGVTAGAHRLWSHRSYKATLTGQILLMVANTVSFQNDIIQWSRDHRCHHKWTDTDADPHNAKRDISDLTNDPVLSFQRRYYIGLVLLFSFIIPTFTPYFLFDERISVSFYVCTMFRYIMTLNVTFCVNSVAHQFGYKPYDKNISPTENPWTTALTLGEGGHNFHHTFPQDYRTSEYPHGLNWSRGIIDLMAAIGWAYDRKVAKKETIQRQIAKNL